MTSEERADKLKEWELKLDEDGRIGLALTVQAFDEWLESVAKNEYDKECGDMLKLLAANRYNVGEKGGLAMMFVMFADGFISGLSKAAELK